MRRDGLGSTLMKIAAFTIYDTGVTWKIIEPVHSSVIFKTVSTIISFPNIV